MKMKNATSYTMGLILSYTPTQHRDSMRKIRQTHTHAQPHAYTAISDESNRSLAYIKKAYSCFFFI